MTNFSLNPQIILDILIAYVYALPVGWEREKHERSAGLRTFPLVCVAACVLVAVAVNSGNKDAPSRVVQGLIAGLGFIGGGTILKTGQAVHGTATAASLLVTAVIGVCVASHLYDVGAMLSLLSLFTLRMFEAWRHLEPGIHKWDSEKSK